MNANKPQQDGLGIRKKYISTNLNEAEVGLCPDGGGVESPDYNVESDAPSQSLHSHSTSESETLSISPKQYVTVRTT